MIARAGVERRGGEALVFRILRSEDADRLAIDRDDDRLIRRVASLLCGGEGDAVGIARHKIPTEAGDAALAGEVFDAVAHWGQGVGFNGRGHPGADSKRPGQIRVGIGCPGTRRHRGSGERRTIAPSLLHVNGGLDGADVPRAARDAEVVGHPAWQFGIQRGVARAGEVEGAGERVVSHVEPGGTELKSGNAHACVDGRIQRYQAAVANHKPLGGDAIIQGSTQCGRERGNPEIQFRIADYRELAGCIRVVHDQARSRKLHPSD